MPISAPVWCKPFIRRLKSRLQGLQPRPESVEYQTWREQFLLDRLKVGLWIAFPVQIVVATNSLLTLFGNSQQIQQDILLIYGDAGLFEQLRSLELVANGVFLAGLLMCWGLRQSRWGQQHPGMIFLLFSSTLTWLSMLVGTVFGIPAQPEPYPFLAAAILIPVRWQLHLVAHCIPIAHYLMLYPLLGITKIGTRDFYDTYWIQRLIQLGWITTVCVLSVYLYEKLKRSEFESRRQLRSVIHAISHDLKNPALGTSVTLQGWLLNPDRQITIDRNQLARLLAGSHRQISMIESLLEAQSAENGALILHCQPIRLETLVNQVIEDLAPIVAQHHMTLSNHVATDLPWVNADKIQIWRVLNNLISNALKHNPSGTQIAIEAELMQHGNSDWIRCGVYDNGIGIAPTQLPELFKLYTRGAKARRMPGLGLGLYLCQQIIVAHQGEIGVESQPGLGSTFWFTLPITVLH